MPSEACLTSFSVTFTCGFFLGGEGLKDQSACMRSALSLKVYSRRFLLFDFSFVFFDEDFIDELNRTDCVVFGSLEGEIDEPTLPPSFLRDAFGRAWS